MCAFDFDSLFRIATVSDRMPSGLVPYPYQRRLALIDALPSMIDIPTGLGKTEAVVLAWLWRRNFASPEIRDVTPRRLVYCLPMRGLVEQTANRISTILCATGLLSGAYSEENALTGAEAATGGGVRGTSLHVMMGGESSSDWDEFPEADCIIVGTQDMLLSAALNRGYASSRYRWPVRFALLNDDCLWVMDEVQLMGAGLPTTVQLQAFREKMGTWHRCQSIWMSATVDRQALCTVDSPETGSHFGLDDSDMDHELVRRRICASKPFSVRPCPDSKKPAQAAAEVLAEHRRGTLTLVVVNTVDRAVKLNAELQKACKNASLRPDLRLVHSRFRPHDRLDWQKQFLSREASIPDDGRIIVSTQVVEAGVDISAATLFTDAAPWASMIQRFGRCNRDGEFDAADSMPAKVVVWEMLDKAQRGKSPYDQTDIDTGVRAIRSMNDVGIQSLRSVKAPSWKVGLYPVIRRKDLLELFDTTPDLTGNDLDVQRWIRDAQDADVYLYWRAGDPIGDEAAADRRELCPVPITEAIKLTNRAGVEVMWLDPLTDEWTLAGERDMRPGRQLRCRCADGGYSEGAGFDAFSKKGVEPVGGELDAKSSDAMYKDRASEDEWLDIAEHTDRVLAAFNVLSASTSVPVDIVNVLRTAICWHDRGKALDSFQFRIKDEGRPCEWVGRKDVAKAPYAAWRRGRNEIVRHELASALSMIQQGIPDLAVYVVAAHHGKVRMALRSLPKDRAVDGTSHECCGIHDGDVLPEVKLGGGMVAPAVTVRLDAMEMGAAADGSPSWVDRSSRLLDSYGPFKLALLETLVRCADWRGSASPAAEGKSNA